MSRKFEYKNYAFLEMHCGTKSRTQRVLLPNQMSLISVVFIVGRKVDLIFKIILYLYGSYTRFIYRLLSPIFRPLYVSFLSCLLLDN